MCTLLFDHFFFLKIKSSVIQVKIGQGLVVKMSHEVLLARKNSIFDFFANPEGHVSEARNIIFAQNFQLSLPEKK